MGGKGGRNALESELRLLGVRQKNSRPNDVWKGRVLPTNDGEVAQEAVTRPHVAPRTLGAAR